MKRPRWVLAVALTFGLFGLLLTREAVVLFQRSVEVDKGGGWFPGLVHSFEHDLSTLCFVLATWLIVTGISIWRKPVAGMRFAGYTAIATGLLPIVPRFNPAFLGHLAIILSVVLLSFGAILIFYSRDAEIEDEVDS